MIRDINDVFVEVFRDTWWSKTPSTEEVHGCFYLSGILYRDL